MTTDGAVDQAELVMRGVASAVRHDGKVTDTQTSLLTAIGKAGSLGALDPNAVFGKSN